MRSSALVASDVLAMRYGFNLRIEAGGQQLAVKNLRPGLPLVINDSLLELQPKEAATFQAIGIAATICMLPVKEGRLTDLRLFAIALRASGRRLS